MKLNSLTNTGVIVLTVILNIYHLPFYIWAQEIEFSVYEDPENRFTIEYPSGWFVQPAKTRFDDIAVAFTSQPSDEQNLTSVDIRIENDVGDVGSETVANYLVSNLHHGVPDLDLYENPECSKYSINGEDTCSFIYSRTGQFLPQYAIMQAIAIIDGDSYSIVYSTSFQNFDISLPIAEKMISSFRLVGSE